jgi:hypothetical protein
LEKVKNLLLIIITCHGSYTNQIHFGNVQNYKTKIEFNVHITGLKNFQHAPH